MNTPSAALLPTLNDAELHVIFRDDERAIWRYRLLVALLHEGRSIRDVAEQEHTTPDTLRALRAQFLETGHLDVLRSKRRGAAGHLKRQTPLAQAVARELAADPGASPATVWRRVAAELSSSDIAVPRRSVYRLVESLRQQASGEDDAGTADELWAPALVPSLRAALGLLRYDSPHDLGESELAVQLLPYESDTARRGRWLHDLLVESVVELGPPTLTRLPPPDGQVIHDPEYRAYDILVGEAWHGRSREDMESLLAVAPATYSRAKRQGLEQLAELVVQKALRKRLAGPQSSPPPPVPVLGRERDIQYYSRRLQGEGFALIWGMSGAGKTAVALYLAHQKLAAGETVVWHQCGGTGTAIVHGVLESYGVYHDPAIMDAHELLSQLRARLRYGATLVLEHFDAILADPVTELLVALLRTMVATRSLQLIITSRCLPQWAEGEGWSPLNGLMEDAARSLWTFWGGAVMEPAAWQMFYGRTLGYPRLLETLAADPEASLEPFFRDEVVEPLPPAERDALVLLLYARGPIRTPVDENGDDVGDDDTRAVAQLKLRDLATYDSESGAYHLHILLQTHRAILQGLVREPTALQRTLAEQAYADQRWYDAIVHWSAEGEIERVVDAACEHLYTLVADRHGPALLDLLGNLRLHVSGGAELAKIEAAIGAYHLALGSYHKATESLRAAIDTAATLGDAISLTDIRAWHYLLAEAYQHMGQWRHALTHVQTSMGNERIISADVAPEERMALALLQHRIWVQAGERKQAQYWLADVQTQLKFYYHPLPAALVAYMEGIDAKDRGAFDQAITRLQTAYDLMPAGVHHGILCQIVASLTLCLAAVGRFADAQKLAETQLQATLGLGHQSGALTLALALVDVALDAGQVDDAVRALGQAELLAETNNDRATAKLYLARAAIAAQRPMAESALDLINEALTIISDPPQPHLMVRAYLQLARLSMAQGALPTAAQHATRAVRVATAAGLQRERAVAQLVLVREALERHAWHEASELLQEANLDADDPMLQGEHAMLHAELLAATGEQDAARAAFRRGEAAIHRAPVSVREQAERRFPAWWSSDIAPIQPAADSPQPRPTAI
jgi:tetratricopeptide (TPR) repeat protein/transposase